MEENIEGNLSFLTGKKNMISRRQDLPDTYIRDGSIYITKSDVLMNKNSLYGNSINYCVSPFKEYINIDTEEDWQKAEKYFKSLK